jgi:hypothetical protein
MDDAFIFHSTDGLSHESDRRSTLRRNASHRFPPGQDGQCVILIVDNEFKHERFIRNGTCDALELGCQRIGINRDGNPRAFARFRLDLLQRVGFDRPEYLYMPQKRFTRRGRHCPVTH